MNSGRSFGEKSGIKAFPEEANRWVFTLERFHVTQEDRVDLVLQILFVSRLGRCKKAVRTASRSRHFRTAQPSFAARLEA